MFAHTSIRTSNMDRSIDFYTRLMGLKLLNRHEIPQNNAEIAFLQDPEGKGAKLELTFYRKQKKFVQADYKDRLFDHIAFEVKSMEQTLSKLRRENITITDEPFKLGPTGPLIAFVEDPDGTLIELIERNNVSTVRGYLVSAKHSSRSFLPIGRYASTVPFSKTQNVP